MGAALFMKRKLQNCFPYVVLSALFMLGGLGHAKSLFWVGGSGNWADASHWSSKSGGTGGAGIPSPCDDVIFDQLSSDAAFTVSISGHNQCKSLSTFRSNKVVFIGPVASRLDVFGDFNLSRNTAFSFGGTLCFRGSRASTISTAGVFITGDIDFDGLGEYVLLDDLLLTETSNVFLNSGVIRTNGHRLRTGWFKSSGPAKKSLVCGSSEFYVEKGWRLEGNLDFIGEDVVVKLNPAISESDIIRGPSGNAAFRTLFSCVNPVNSNDTLYVELNVTSNYSGEDISCNGACDGQITVTASSTQGGPFSYSFQGGGASSQTVFPNLCVGNYSVTVVDSSQIVFFNPNPVYFQCTRDIDINEPSIISLDNEFAINPPSCPDSCDGAYLVTAAGGAGGYIYNWSNGDIGATSFNLCTGWNTITIFDANGCSFQDSINIIDPLPIYANVTASGVSCFGICDGYLVSEPSGGNGAPFIWDWSNGSSADSIGGLCAGIYNLTIYDSNNCPYDTTGLVVTTPLQILVSVINHVNNVCNGACAGELEVSVAQGTAPYTFEWKDGSGAIIGQTNALATGLCAGTYYCVVTDANGCRDSSAVLTITEPTLIVPSVNVNDVLCFGDCNGVGSVSAVGGIPGYSYQWVNNGTGLPVGNGTNINTLCAGDYFVNVTDANGCVVPSAVVTVNEPPVLDIQISDIDILCQGLCTGSATIVIAGGTGPYSVQWFTSPGNTLIAGQTALTLPNRCDGDYYAVVTDANGCSAQSPVADITEPTAISISNVDTDISCNGVCDGTITATISGGTAPYTQQWQLCPAGTNIVGETAQTISNLCPGQYRIRVTDANGCTSTSPCATITQPTAVSISITSTTNANCGGFCDGQAVASASGGTAPLSVAWYNVVGDVFEGSGNSINTLCTGSYYAVVTDANGCDDTTVVFVITDNITVNANLTTNDATCNGFCDGSASVIANGGTPPYTYLWTSVSTGNIISTTTFANGLCAGDYTVTVLDANSCSSVPQVFTITDDPALSGVLTVNDAGCFGDCDGTASIVVAGGIPGYTYQWFPAPGAGQGTANASQLCAGNYQVTVTDNRGCSFDSTLVISQPTAFDLTVALTHETCDGFNDGTATVVVNSGGNPPFTFSWAPAPGAGQGTGTATNMSPGTYNLTITDAVGCDSVVTIVINSATPLSANASVIANNLCNGDCNGIANVLALGGTGSYSYNWVPAPPIGQGTSTASSLCAGVYTVTVTDGNGCVDSDNVTITQLLAFTINSSFTDAVCSGGCTGQAAVSVVSGGTAPYIYSWDDPLGQTTATAFNLCAGNVNATVTDLNGCSIVVPFTISEPAALSVTLNSTNTTCFGVCVGTADVVIAGGVAPYTVQWFNSSTGASVGTGVAIASLCAGTFYAVITDAEGCTFTTADFDVNELPDMDITLVTIESNCVNCVGGATASVTGGSGVYVNYQWSPAPVAGQGTPIATAMCSGVYGLTVTDDAGCTASVPVPISDAPTEIFTLDSTDATCFGSCDGTTTINFVCSQAPCTVEWYDDLGNFTGQTANTATGLCAGTYAVSIENGGGCLTTGTIEVNDGTPITVTTSFTEPACNGDCNGDAAVVPTGGIAPFAYNWTPVPLGGQGTSSATGLCAGVWDVEITDGNGCDTVVSFNLTNPAVLDVSNIVSNDISCAGLSDGSATVFPVGGVGAYTYQWFDCVSGLPIGQTIQSATGLAAGSYFVVVTDQVSCGQTTNCVVINDATPVTGVLSSTNVVCHNNCDGTATVVPSGGNNNYTQQWSSVLTGPIAGATGTTATNLCPGDYTVLVEDLNGCQVTLGPVTITQPTPFDISVVTVDATCNGGADGSAVVTVNSGGTPAYSFNWVPAPVIGQGTGSVTGLSAGNYTVTLSDAASCDTTFTVTISEPVPFTFSAVATPVTCNGDADGAIVTNVNGGSAPYNFNWLPNGETTSSIVGITAGVYTVNIQDAAGCLGDTTITILDPAVLTVSSSSNDAACSVANGNATVVIAGGYGAPYSITWSPAPGGGQGTTTATGLAAGIYTATIVDPGGCTVLESVAVSNIGAEFVGVSSTDASCFDVCDGTATAIYACGDAPCVQEWFDAATGLTTGQTGLNANGLCQGDYFVEVTNASNCLSIVPVTVSSPTEILANETTSNPTCSGTATGSVTVAPSGGSGAGYTFVWSPAPGGGQGTATATGLSAGNWQVTITDGTGCDSTFTFVLNDPTAITTSTVSTDVNCNGASDGTATTTPLGGAIPYTYQWLDAGLNPIPGETNAAISGLAAGDYSVVITDLNGCSITDGPVTISEPAALSVNISVVDVLCFGDCNGTGTAVVAGGTAPVTINWFFVSTGLSAGVSGTNVSGLCPDDYFAIATDANGCQASSGNATVSEPVMLSSTAAGADVSCFGQCDGTAISTPAGGTLPYSYNWLDGSGNPVPGGSAQNVGSLCADLYSVAVSDNNGCTVAPISVLIQEPAQITGTMFINDASCAVPDGSASIVAAGGAGGFAYQWVDDLFVPIPGETAATLAGVPAGTYYVNVTDASGCTDQFQANISNLNAPVVTVDAVTDVSCNGGADGGAQVTIVALNNPYTALWNPGGVIAEDPGGLTAGTYTLTVTDAAGCLAFANITINEPTALSATFVNTSASCGVCDATATVSPSGGMAPYSILWSNGDAGTTANNLCVGGYMAQITDANGCVSSINTNIGSNGGPTGQLINVTAPTCNGSCDGTATVTATGGTAPYTYFWVGIGFGGPTQTGLCAGTYLVQAADATGCVSDINFTIADPAVLVVTDNITPNTCGLCDGEVGLSVSGGVLPYTFNWSSGGATATESGLCSGVYTVDISDGTGCSQTFTYLMNSAPGPSAVLTVTDELCAFSCDGSIDAVISGGSAPYVTTWLDGVGTPIGQTLVPATGLCTGDYILQIVDGAGCTGFAIATVDGPTPLVFNVPVTNPTECAAACTGSATAIPIGGTLPYTFTWNPGGFSGSTANGLCDGVYTVDVADANGCSGSQTITIGTSLTLTASVTSNDATCGICDGDATLNISGGAAPYSVVWSNGSTGTAVNGLCAGIYTADITDGNGCTQQVTVTINDLGGPTGETIAQSDASCFGLTDGSATVTPIGGTAPYSYLWVPSGITTNTINNLAAASYTLEVSDANGCIRVVTVDIAEPAEILPNQVTTNPTCGQCNGTIALLTTGGDGGPFTYAWTGGLPATGSQGGVCAGIYDVTVTDGSGCSIVETIAISSTNGPVLSVTGVDPNCFGVCDGSVNVTPTTGAGPFDIVWNTGDIAASVASLCGGTYTVQVTDQSTGCVSTGQTNLTDPSQLGLSIISVIDAGCTGVCDGQASSIASGGTLPLTYLWSDPAAQSTATATGLCQGIYTVQVTDANGCSGSQSAIITTDPAITATFVSNDATCGLCDGDATVTPAGGVAPYTITWSDGQTGTTASNLCAGVYTAQITGANGCSVQVDVTINNTGGPTGENIVQTDASCFGATDGSVTITPVGGTAPYSYLWVPSGNTTNTLNNLSAGTYTLEVIDANNCIRVVPVTITEPTQISGNPQMFNTDCGACNGAINLLTSGGAGGYTYSWTGGLPAQANQSGLCAGLYDVTITDVNGCSTTESVPVSSTNAPVFSTTSTDPACGGVCDGTAQVTPVGAGPFTYLWSNGATTDIINGLCGGTYTVQVTDVTTGCVGSSLVTLTDPAALGFSVANVVDAGCVGGCDGQATVIPSGGTLPYAFVWNDPSAQTTATATGLCQGIYNVSVTDANGCTVSQSVIINNSPAITISSVPLDATCGLCDGSAVVTPTGGTAPYTITWSDGQSGTNATNLCAGVYTVQVTGANGCSQQEDVVINNVGGPTGETINQTDVSCFGLSDGSVTVTPSGGTAPYTYLWVPSGNTNNTLNNLSAGTYTLEVIDANNCIRVVPVNINQPVSMQVSPQLNNPDCGACNGSIQLLPTGGAGGYTYSWSGGLPATAVQTNVCAGLYDVTVTDINGCSQVFSLPLASTQAPLVSITAIGETCNSDCDGTLTTTVSGTPGPYTYLWSDGQSAANLSNLCPGTYSVIVTDNTTGCIGAGFAEVLGADTLGTSVPNGIDASCFGICDGEAAAVISGGTLPLTYFWNDPATQTTSIATGLCAGSYFATVTDANGCSILQTVTINEPAAIVVTIDSIVDATCLNSANGEVYVTATGGAGGLTYSWVTDPAGFTSTSEDITGLNPMNYILTVTDVSGCFTIDTTLVDTLFILVADAGPDLQVCPGLPFTIIGQAASTFNIAYSWTDLSGNILSNDSVLTQTQVAGVYTYVLQVSDDSCSHTDTVIVTVTPPPLADAGPDFDLIKGEEATIGGTPTGPVGSTIVWSPGSYFTVGDSSYANPTVSPDSTIDYVVMVTDTNGCVGYDTVNIYVYPDITFPNGFSPNGDGVNEVWEIDFITRFPECTVEVFNRWGEPLFYSKGYTTPWDGRYNDKPLPVGTYYYIINLNHPLFPDAYTGPITILR
jgi:gliding motility-associated-like protein